MTKRIPLGRKGQLFALVDEEDFMKVAHLAWHKSICDAAQRRPYKGKNRDKRKTCIFLHYVILDLVGKKGVKVKHINGNRLDCRKKNMLIVRKDGPLQNH